MAKLLLTLLLTLICSHAAFAQHCYVFIGSYNDNVAAEGLYVYKLDTTTGKLVKVTSVKAYNSSFLTLTDDSKHIYACTETRTPNAGSVSSYAFDAAKGTLTFINKQKSGGENPVYAVLDKTGRWLVNANYTEGSISAYSVDSLGAIGPAAQILPFSEGSIDKDRQERAHIHAAVFSPNGTYAFFPDLGADKIRCYAFDAGAVKPLSECPQPFISIVPGSGPRHFAFHPGGRYAYCIEELSGFVQAFRYADGRLDTMQRIAAHRGRQKGDYSSADIHCSADGRFLYVSNRGNENNIAIFAIDESSGKLSLAGFQSTVGDHPRNFCIDPSGKFLLVANQVTGNVVVFRRDAKTGLLSDTGARIKVPGASCVQMRYIR